MTREEFDKKQRHKDMRCIIETEVNGKTKKSYGTIVKVHFGGQFVGVMLDGKDYVMECIGCECITLQEDYERQQREQQTLVTNAQAITDQITVEMVNHDRLRAILKAGLVQAVRIEHGAVYVDIDQYFTVENGDWLVRLKDGTVSRCPRTYHKKMEQAGLISGECFGFKDIPQR